jgi:hypothetical protein
MKLAPGTTIRFLGSVATRPPEPLDYIVRYLILFELDYIVRYLIFDLQCIK